LICRYVLYTSRRDSTDLGVLCRLHKYVTVCLAQFQLVRCLILSKELRLELYNI
jgi:hypothetical protein